MQTIISISLHREQENPVFGEGNIFITLADEAAGAFIEITQNTDNPADAHKIKINPEELDEVIGAAKMLLGQKWVK